MVLKTIIKKCNGAPSSEQVSSNFAGEQSTNSSPQRGEKFADGRRETSPDSLVFPRPLWERVRVRGVNGNNNKRLMTDWIVSHTYHNICIKRAYVWLKSPADSQRFQPALRTLQMLFLTMTKNFTNNAILWGLNNCSPQKDGKNSCRLMRGEVRKTTRKVAFTLAEVLITLGIIGIVAAMTIPSLISKYQKHVYYNQFLKAVSVLGNAEKLYINDYCGGDATNCSFGYDPSTFNPNFYNDFSQYFKIIKKINKKNYEEVCSGYTKLPVSEGLDGSQRAGNACSQDWIMPYDEGADYGFITADGMMFNLGVFEGPMEGGFVDINGPDKGPNIVGRDIFHFIYQNGNRNSSQKMGIFWNTETYMKTYGYGENYSCADKYDSWNNSWTCGERLLKDGKMDY